MAGISAIHSEKHYISGIEYNGTAIEAIYNTEGRVVPNGASWTYEYTLRDHLGNARASFRYNSGVQLIQENHYYPFGMQMEGAWAAQVGTENGYQYNRKELNEDFGLGLYDYGARWYDPTIGRWNHIDPLSEKYFSQTGYQYVSNNPVLMIDPFGLFGESPNEVMKERQARKKKQKNGESSNGDQDIDISNYLQMLIKAGSGNGDAQKKPITAVKDYTLRVSGDDPITPATEANRKNISPFSWGESKGCFPVCSKGGWGYLTNPDNWDAELLKDLQEVRAVMDYIAKNRNSDHQKETPSNADFSHNTNRMLMAYHLSDNLPEVPDYVTSNENVRWYQMSLNPHADHSGINNNTHSEVIEKIYGPFYNNNSRNRGPIENRRLAQEFVYIIVYSGTPK